MYTTAMSHAVYLSPPHAKHQKTVKVTLWVKPAVKAELKRLAGMDGLTLSKTGATLLEEAIHQKLHIQHALLLQPIIEQTVRKELRVFGNRLVFFLMRIAFASEQARILITNVLDRRYSDVKACESRPLPAWLTKATAWHDAISSTRVRSCKHCLTSGKPRLQRPEGRATGSPMADGNCESYLHQKRAGREGIHPLYPAPPWQRGSNHHPHLVWQGWRNGTA
jgi:hypothetical protein